MGQDPAGKPKSKEQANSYFGFSPQCYLGVGEPLDKLTSLEKYNLEKYAGKSANLGVGEPLNKQLQSLELLLPTLSNILYADKCLK